MKKIEKGITLVALVITVIILLILAGVSISILIGENGVLEESKVAVEKNEKATATEKMNLKITNVQMVNYAKKERMPTLQELADHLCEDEEIQYVTKEPQRLASLDKIEIGEAKSFFTKLKEYPYEFEINSSLQLASINGVEIATNPTPEETIPNSENTMSAEEHFIGKYFFDGKPIYEKTIYIASLPNATTKTYNHQIANVDNIWITQDSYLIWASGEHGVIPHVGTYTGGQMPCAVGKEVLQIETGRDNRSGLSAYITLRFTKTTDEGNGNTIPATPAN